MSWNACLGRCGVHGPGGAFKVVREAASVAHVGDAWSVTLHLRANHATGAGLRILRGTKAVRALQVAPGAGKVDIGPFLLTPATYTLRLTLTDAYGRTRSLTWFAVLPR